MKDREPHWPARLRRELEELTGAAAKKIWPGPDPDAPPYFNYRLEHVRQVDRYARILLREVGGDAEVVEAAVWVHDRFKPLFEGRDHASRAVAWLRENIVSYGFPASKVEAVAFAVENHVGFLAPHDRIPPEKVEARILWDADKLDKFGLHAVTNLLMANAAYPGSVLTHASSARPFRPLPSDEELRDRYFFEVSYRLALENLRVQRRYYADLEKELGIAPDG
jgi:uncharacterized protein